MLGSIFRSLRGTSELRASRREERRQAIAEHRAEQERLRRETETCHHCRGSRMCHYCGGARHNDPHDLGAGCSYCRDGRCSYCG